MRLTPWYPANIKPVREGPYQTKVQGYLGYSFWSDGRWGNQCGSVADLCLQGGRMPGEQNKEWRGMAYDWR